MKRSSSFILRLATLAIGSQLITGIVLAEHRDKDATLAELRNKKIEISRDTAPVTPDMREKAMEGYKIFLRSPLGGAMRREALRRLADQIIEQLEEREYNIVEGLDKSGTAPQADQAQQGAPYKEGTYADAIKLYEEALSSYPNALGSEHIYYQLARAYEANGEPEKAFKALEILSTQYPYSSYGEEALFRQAELAFLLRKFKEAEQAYKKLLERNEKSQLHEIAMYKYAWSLFKQRRLDQALDNFYLLLDRSIAGMRLEDFIADMPTLSASSREMVKDTLRVIALAYSDLEGPITIKEYFATIEVEKDDKDQDKPSAHDYEFMVYEALADLYLRQELYNEAANTYKTFIEVNPTHPRAPFFQLLAMQTFLDEKFISLALEEKKAFANNYGLTNNFWKGQPPELREQITPYLHWHISELAQHYHAQTQKTKSVEDYQEAIHWYRAFLDSFPKNPEAANMNFLLAELLYDMELYQDAAEEYDRTAYRYSKHANTTEAGYAALLAFDKYAKTLEGEAKAEWQRQGIASAKRFATQNPQDPRLPIILTKTAQEEFTLNDIEGAIRSAQKVVNFRPQAPAKLRRSAWLIIAHSLFDMEQYPRAETAYQSVLNVTTADDPNRGKIIERLAASIYKQGEQMRSEGKLSGAIRHFTRIAEAAPDSAIRYTADYDAAAAMIALERWRDAIGILEQFRHTAKGKELEYDVTQKLAVAYLEVGDNRNAARELQKLATQGGDYDVQRDAVWRAAELYEKSNDLHGAIEAYNTYAEKYRQPLETNVEAQYKLTVLYHKTQQQSQRQRWLQRIIKDDKENNPQNNDRIRFLAATASYELAAPILESYQGVALKAPFKDSLKKKKDNMQNTIKAYTTAANYGIASITTAATFQIAELYHDFAKALMSSERPKELSKDELEMYDVMLEEQAYPFEEKSIEIHEKNTDRVTQNVYDEWVKKSFAKLGEIMPGRYDKHEIIEPLIDVLN